MLNKLKQIFSGEVEDDENWAEECWTKFENVPPTNGDKLQVLVSSLRISYT